MTQTRPVGCSADSGLENAHEEWSWLMNNRRLQIDRK